ncbi:9,11-endoperoxide prostaglandin H2 reductase-like [Sycon ciliatum]|uniref:9,11-endoperoxide prostaglandin H2 reductase-like n=1 Tax=Sycon ciliatum TaxID=27933 RepID=UPI0031F6CE06
MAVTAVALLVLCVAAFTQVTAAASSQLNVPHSLGDGPVSVRLRNAAMPGVMMPVAGLGTGNYGPPGELWDVATCEEAVLNFLKSGGRRIDGALTYNGQLGVASAIKASGIPRSEIFITSKTPLAGFNETMRNFEQVLSDLNTTYVDLLLIHEPCSKTRSTDPNCPPNPTSHKSCRLSQWRAMQEIFKSGRAKSIGVSNYVARHVQEIIDTPGMLLPTVVQNEFQPYCHDNELVTFCWQHNITFNSYAPLTTPDYGPVVHNWPLKRGVLDEPTMLAIGKKYGKTSAQVTLRWHWEQSIVVNPRSMNASHIAENLGMFDFKLNAADMEAIAAIVPPSVNGGRVCGNPYKCT